MEGVGAYRRCGIVTVKVDKIVTAVPATWTELGTLPAGWRPPAQIYAAGEFGVKEARLYAHPNGRVAAYLFDYSGSGSLTGSFTFPTA